MWDDSIPLNDTVSVLVRRSEIMKVRALYEELAEGDVESTKTLTQASLPRTHRRVISQLLTPNGGINRISSTTH